jgi:hypothetical protein
MIEFRAFKNELDKTQQPIKASEAIPQVVNEESESSQYDEALQALKDSNLEENKTYKIYRDKAETFVCDMEITGASATNSKARIIMECKDLTYMFEGTIDDNGQCRIPLRKMNFLQENEGGVIKLEVIAEDMVFQPWQDNFVAVNSKKVSVKISESVETAPKVGIKITNIR